MLTIRRVRRIKCDEGFPACYRCVSMGHVCPGYGIWGGGGAIQCNTPPGSVKSRRLLSIAATKEQILTFKLPGRTSPTYPGPRISSEEQTYLEWFLHGTATYSPRFFATPFWTPIILQATMDSPMILQALLALSSVHKRKALDPANRVRDGLLPDAQEMFMLRQYGNAMQNLQKHLRNEMRSSRPQLLMAVITCGLFILLEGTRNNYDAAYVHVTSGIRLQRKLVEITGKKSLGVIQLNFLPRLKDQMEIYRQRQRSEVHTLIPPASLPTLRFESLTEAGNHLDILIEESAHAAEEARSLVPSSTGALKTLVKEEQAYYTAALDAWYLTFKVMMASKTASMTLDEKMAWKALQQRHEVARNMAYGNLGMDTKLKVIG
jgi:hypothetical protein